MLNILISWLISALNAIRNIEKLVKYSFYVGRLVE